MAIQNFVFNVAKGRVIELVHRVDSNDPANSALIIVPLSAGGTAAQGQDFDTLAQVLADTANWVEQTTGAWVRKPLSDTLMSDFTIDDTGNITLAALPTIVWTAPTANIVGLLVCYDPDVTSGTDTTVIPMSCHVLSVTGNGNDYTLNAGNFFQAG